MKYYSNATTKYVLRKEKKSLQLMTYRKETNLFKQKTVDTRKECLHVWSLLTRAISRTLQMGECWTNVCEQD